MNAFKCLFTLSQLYYIPLLNTLELLISKNTIALLPPTYYKLYDPFIHSLVGPLDRRTRDTRIELFSSFTLVKRLGMDL